METATNAAAAGGITMVIDMPLNSDPTTTTVALLEKKIGATRVSYPYIPSHVLLRRNLAGE